MVADFLLYNITPKVVLAAKPELSTFAHYKTNNHAIYKKATSGNKPGTRRKQN